MDNDQSRERRGGDEMQLGSQKHARYVDQKTVQEQKRKRKRDGKSEKPIIRYMLELQNCKKPMEPETTWPGTKLKKHPEQRRSRKKGAAWSFRECWEPEFVVVNGRRRAGRNAGNEVQKASGDSPLLVGRDAHQESPGSR
jgi:hypothetical protein